MEFYKKIPFQHFLTLSIINDNFKISKDQVTEVFNTIFSPDSIATRLVPAFGGQLQKSDIVTIIDNYFGNNPLLASSFTSVFGDNEVISLSKYLDAMVGIYNTLSTENRDIKNNMSIDADTKVVMSKVFVNTTKLILDDVLSRRHQLYYYIIDNDVVDGNLPMDVFNDKYPIIGRSGTPKDGWKFNYMLLTGSIEYADQIVGVNRAILEMKPMPPFVLSKDTTDLINRNTKIRMPDKLREYIDSMGSRISKADIQVNIDQFGGIEIVVPDDPKYGLTPGAMDEVVPKELIDALEKQNITFKIEKTPAFVRPQTTRTDGGCINMLNGGVITSTASYAKSTSGFCIPNPTLPSKTSSQSTVKFYKTVPGTQTMTVIRMQDVTVRIEGNPNTMRFIDYIASRYISIFGVKIGTVSAQPVEKPVAFPTVPGLAALINAVQSTASTSALGTVTSLRSMISSAPLQTASLISEEPLEQQYR